MLDPRSQESEGVSLSLLKDPLVRQWRLISACALVAAGLGLVVSFLLPPVFDATATILPRRSQETSSLAMLGASLGAGGAMLDLFSGGKGADLTEILSSRAMAERVIHKLSLEQKLKGWKTRNQLVDKVRKLVKVKTPSVRTTAISIVASGPTAELASAIANAYVDELKGFLDQMGYSDAANYRAFLAKQVEHAKQELGDSEAHLTKFQSENRIVSLPDSVRASMETIASLQAKRIQTGAELRATQGTYEALSNHVTSLQADPNRLADLQVQSQALRSEEEAIRNAEERFRVALGGLPPKATEFAKLQRDQVLKSTIYVSLSQQYQMAMLAEQKESNAFVLLDKAVRPDFPARPSKKIYTAVGLLSGLIIGASAAFTQAKRQHGVA